MKIEKTISIEELTEQVSGSVEYLMRKGIRCIVCGEPIWGTLEEAAQEKGFSEQEIEIFVKELNELALKPDSDNLTKEKRIDIKRI